MFISKLVAAAITTGVLGLFVVSPAFSDPAFGDEVEGGQSKSALAAAAQAVDAGPSNDAPADRFRLSASVRSKLFIDSEGDFDASYSHLALSLQNRNLKDALDHFGTRTAPSSSILNLNLKLSAVPYLVERNARNRVFEGLDGLLAQQRQAMVPGIENQVDAALARDPNFQQLPPQLQAQVRQQFLNRALAQLDIALQEARTFNRARIVERISQIKRETVLQEISVGAGKALGKRGAALGYIKLGKFHIEHGPPVNEAFESRLEEVRPTNSRVQRGTGVIATGASALGVVKTIGEAGSGQSLRGDLYVFHNRPSFISGNDYIDNIVTLPEPIYDELRHFSHLDSALLRVLKQTPRHDVYASVGYFKEADNPNLPEGTPAQYKRRLVLQAGGSLRLSPDSELHLDYFRGDRLQLSQGASLFFVHRANQRLTGYAGYERVWDTRQPSRDLNGENEGNLALGLSYGLVRNTAEPSRSRLNLSVSTELRYDPQRRNGLKPFVGLRFLY